MTSTAPVMNDEAGLARNTTLGAISARQGVAALRGVLDPVAAELRPVDRGHLGLDVAGRDRVEPGCPSRPTPRPATSSAGARRPWRVEVLGGLPLRAVDDHPRDRAHVDDRPAARGGHEEQAGGHAALPQRGHVQVEHLRPFIVGHLRGFLVWMHEIPALLTRMSRPSRAPRRPGG